MCFYLRKSHKWKFMFFSEFPRLIPYGRFGCRLLSVDVIFLLPESFSRIKFFVLVLMNTINTIIYNPGQELWTICS